MFGVHSAMPSSVARRLCPSAVFVDGRFHRYVEESRKLHDIFESVTPLVEGISLDEAFLDVTGSRQLLGDGVTIAESIRRRVAEELELTCSVGVGRSKLMAKLASKAAKPVADRSGITPGPGVVVVPPDGELEFLHPLPVRALWGVGPVTGRRLDALGINTVGDIAALAPGALERYLGTAQGAPSGRPVPRPRPPPGGARPGGQVDRPRGDLRVRPLGPWPSCTATWCAWWMPRPPLFVVPSFPPGPSASRSDSATSPSSPGPTPWAHRSTPHRPSERWLPRCWTRSTWRLGFGCWGSACPASVGRRGGPS